MRAKRSCHQQICPCVMLGESCCACRAFTTEKNTQRASWILLCVVVRLGLYVFRYIFISVRQNNSGEMTNSIWEHLHVKIKSGEIVWLENALKHFSHSKLFLIRDTESKNLRYLVILGVFIFKFSRIWRTINTL